MAERERVNESERNGKPRKRKFHAERPRKKDPCRSRQAGPRERAKRTKFRQRKVYRENPEI